MSQSDVYTVYSWSTLRDDCLNISRKIFFAAGRHWVCFPRAQPFPGTWYAASSADLITWNLETLVVDHASAGAGWRMSFVWDGTHLHYTRATGAAPTGPLYYRRGVPQTDGSIAWDAVEQTVYNVVDDTVGGGMLAVDSSGYPWIGHGIHNVGDPAGMSVPWVRKGANNDGTWALDFATQLDAALRNWRIIVVALTGDKMYVLKDYSDWGVYKDYPKGMLYDGGWGAWEDALTGTRVVYGRVYATAIDDDVLLIVNNHPPSANREILYTRRDAATGLWSAQEYARTDVTDAWERNFGLSRSADGSTVYVFWTDGANGYFSYKRGTDDWVGNTPTTRLPWYENEVYWNWAGSRCSLMQYGDVIGVAWVGTDAAGVKSIRYKPVTFASPGANIMKAF